LQQTDSHATPAPTGGARHTSGPGPAWPAWSLIDAESRSDERPGTGTFPAAISCWNRSRGFRGRYSGRTHMAATPDAEAAGRYPARQRAVHPAKRRVCPVRQPIPIVLSLCGQQLFMATQWAESGQSSPCRCSCSDAEKPVTQGRTDQHVRQRRVGDLIVFAGARPGSGVGFLRFRPARNGPVAVWCRSFDHAMCSNGDEPWAQPERMNFARMRCGSR
jgi:hypothetical protein